MVCVCGDGLAATAEAGVAAVFLDVDVVEGASERDERDAEDDNDNDGADTSTFGDASNVDESSDAEDGVIVS